MYTAMNETDATGTSAGQTPDKALSISVIMPVYNGAEFIVRSLPPLLDMKQRGEVLEVIVIDDGSTDSSQQIADELGAVVLSSGGRLGPGAARNQAAEVAQGEFLWFVDADVVVHSDAAQCLVKGFATEQIVAVFGSYDSNPPARNFFSQYKNLVHHYYHQRASDEAQTFWSGCGAVRRDAFLASGGFDVERYQYPSIEDIELGHRLIGAGGRVRLLRDVQCTHLKVWRFGNLIHTEIFRRAIPWSRLILGSGSGIPNDLNVGMSEQVRAGIAGFLFLSILAYIVGIVGVSAPLLMAMLVLYANWEILQFFYKKGGPVFACGALLYHQVYYLYSASAFAWVYIEQNVLGYFFARPRGS
ncbi:Putative glycosyltransferase EpsH [Halioglobus japonicus]|nr:Putative glycosyltransferase EpsH [Halioglobus japonicus]